jgi:hypothetical protein
MVKRRVADVLQEQAQKFTPDKGESVIEVAAEAIVEHAESAEELSTDTPEQTPAKRTSPTKADLEAIVKELQETLEQSQEKEKKLQQQNSDLQLTLSQEQAFLLEQKALVERLTKELYDAKKAALQLAEANSQLIEASNVLKKEKEKEKESIVVKQEKQFIPASSYRKSYQSSEKAPQQQPEQNQLKPAGSYYKKSYYSSEKPPQQEPEQHEFKPAGSYKKSHRSSVNLAQNQPDEGADNSSQMWLLD